MWPVSGQRRRHERRDVSTIGGRVERRFGPATTVRDTSVSVQVFAVGAVTVETDTAATATVGYAASADWRATTPSFVATKTTPLAMAGLS